MRRYVFLGDPGISTVLDDAKMGGDGVGRHPRLGHIGPPSQPTRVEITDGIEVAPVYVGCFAGRQRLDENRSMYREWELPQAEVRCAWSVDTTTGGWWTQPATEFWGLGFSSTVDGVSAEVVGPAAHPQRFELHPGDRFWGVELQAHVFLRALPKSSFELVQALPTTSDIFRLGERDYAIPDEHHLGEIVDALVAEGVLSTEPAVALALSGREQPGGRTLRRHMREVTGLNRQQIAGIARARTAFKLLSEGIGIGEVVELAGYSDQAHLTRSLRALAGRTPREILSGR